MEKIYKGEIQRLFPIFEAIKEGKTIQWLDMGLWRDIDGDDEGFFLDTLIGKTDGYRIKSEPKYRPFANAEECWAEMLKHQPFGWTIDKAFPTKECITNVISKGIVYGKIESKEDIMSFEAVFNYFKFADGTPFGIKVEE